MKAKCYSQWIVISLIFCIFLATIEISMFSVFSLKIVKDISKNFEQTKVPRWTEHVTGGGGIHPLPPLLPANCGFTVASNYLKHFEIFDTDTNFQTIMSKVSKKNIIMDSLIKFWYNYIWTRNSIGKCIYKPALIYYSWTFIGTVILNQL